MRRRAASEEDFPSDREEVEGCIYFADVFNFAVLIFGGMEEASVLELLAPSYSLLAINLLKQLGQGFGLLLTLNIGHKLDDSGIFLGDLHSSRIRVKKLKTEELITLFLVVV